MKKFDRVILKEDFVKGKKIAVSKNTIGTIREIINPDNALLQIDFIDNHPKIIGVPLTYLNIVTSQDLDTLQNLNDCIKILNKLYHPHNEYISKDGIIYTIKGIRLGANELDDEFMVSTQNGNHIESKLVSRKFLDDNTSFLDTASNVITQNEINTKETITPIQQDQNFDTDNIDEITIIINGYNFILNGQNIKLPNININDIKKFDIVYNKFLNFMNRNGG